MSHRPAISRLRDARAISFVPGWDVVVARIAEPLRHTGKLSAPTANR